jgi:hypothetical protein
VSVSGSPALKKMDANRVFRAMRDEWDALDGLEWNELRGLVVRPYPPFMIGPTENAVKVQASRPAPIAPDCAPVRRLSDGRAALLREVSCRFCCRSRTTAPFDPSLNDACASVPE